jgi:hypothetical protein
MDYKIYYVVFFEGNMFQSFGDFFSGSKCISKDGPYLTEMEATQQSVKYIRACIVYNSLNQSFSNDPRHAGYAYDAVHNLLTWAKQNIVTIKRRSFVSTLSPVPEIVAAVETASLPIPIPESDVHITRIIPKYVAAEDYSLTAHAELVVPEEPAVLVVPEETAPVPEETAPVPEETASAETAVLVVPSEPASPEPASPSESGNSSDNENYLDPIPIIPAKWSFFEHNSIRHEQENLDINVEIGNIAEKVFTAIKAYGGDFLSIANLAKGITFNLGLGMTSSKGVNEILKEVEDIETGGMSSFLIIKLEKSKSSKKISVPGLFSRNKSAAVFSVDYTFFKPKNAAAQAICEDLLDTKIQHKINFLKNQLKDPLVFY